MFDTNNLEFKVNLVNNLRELSFNDNLMNCLFRLMTSFKNASLRLFSSSQGNVDEKHIDELITNSKTDIGRDDFALDESFQNKNVQVYACQMYKSALKSVPAMLRDWWNIQPKRIADQVNKLFVIN